MAAHLQYELKHELDYLPLDVSGCIMGTIKQHGLLAAINQALPPSRDEEQLTLSQVAALLLVKQAVGNPFPWEALPLFARRLPLAAWLEDESAEPLQFNQLAVTALLQGITKYGAERFFDQVAAPLLNSCEFSRVTGINVASFSCRVSEQHTESLMVATAWASNLAVAVPIAAYPCSGKPNFKAFLAHHVAALKARCPKLKYLVCTGLADVASAAQACQEAGLHLIVRLSHSMVPQMRQQARAEAWPQVELVSSKTEQVSAQFALGGGAPDQNQPDGKLLLIDAEAQRYQLMPSLGLKAELELRSAYSVVDAIAASSEAQAQLFVQDTAAQLKFSQLYKSKVWAEQHAFYAMAEMGWTEDTIEAALERELHYVLWSSDHKTTERTLFRHYQPQAALEDALPPLLTSLRCAFYSGDVAAQHLSAYNVIQALALLLQTVVINELQALAKQHKLRLPRLSSNMLSSIPEWERLVQIFEQAQLQFDFKNGQVVLGGLPEPAIPLLEAAPLEVKKLFCDQFLQLYRDAMQRGYRNYRPIATEQDWE